MTQDSFNASLTPDEVAQFRKRLLDKRAEVLGDMIDLRDEAARPLGEDSLSSVPDHAADRSDESWNDDMTRRLAENERDLVLEIDRALARIDDGTYGRCEVTGEAISRERLDARPWARRSVEAARDVESPATPAEQDNL